MKKDKKKQNLIILELHTVHVSFVCKQNLNEYNHRYYRRIQVQEPIFYQCHLIMCEEKVKLLDKH
jgi:hypothetical protein